MARFLPRCGGGIVGESRTVERLAKWSTASVVVLVAVLALIVAGSAYAASTSKIEAETMALSGSAVLVHSSGDAAGGKDGAFYSSGSASKTVSGAVSEVTLRARESYCGGHAKLAVYVDGALKGTVTLTSSSFLHYPVPLSGLADTTHTLTVSYKNDYSTGTCDRNAYLDYVLLNTPDVPPAPTTGNPFAGAKLYVDPNRDAVATVRQWEASGRLEGARQLRKISQSASPPMYFAEWTEYPNDGVQFYVDHFAREWNADGSLPVFGAYALPHRDCGSYSGGGFTTAAQYKAWIDGYARGIGYKKVVVVLEPDGLAGMSCLTDAQRRERMDLIKYAVYALKAQPNAHVYVDAGHSRWQTAETMVSRLKASGIERADGFALNNANFNWTSEEITYGEKISAGVGG
jgi:Glycosyl hydrolases family 6/Ca-dependent carbohydrate-binding module xylan-binding